MPGIGVGSSLVALDVRRRGSLQTKALATSRPTDITGLVSWHDFSDQSTLYTDAGTTLVTADAQSIYQVNDKSGNGYHVIQATAGARPLYKVNLLNGKSGALYDGTDDVLTKTPGYFDMSATSLLTTYVVAYQTASGSGGGAGSFDISIAAGTNTGLNNFCEGAAMKARVHDSTGSIDRTNVSLTNADWTAAQILTTVYNGPGNLLDLYQNGIQKGSNPSPTTDDLVSVQLDIGAQHTVYYFPGYIHELIVYSTAHSTANKNLVGRYLAAKYGLTWTTIP